jgi:hypothetical protein
MSHEIKFKEVHYLGRNSYGLSRRLVMMVFCFIAHFYSEEKGNIDGVFIIVGLVILLLSIVLWYVPYYTIELQNNSLSIISSRKKVVTLPLKVITHVETGIYNRFHLNNPVFNVLNNGEYKFYAEGRKALLLNLEGGNRFKIGMKRPEILYTEIKKSMA